MTYLYLKRELKKVRDDSSLTNKAKILLKRELWAKYEHSMELKKCRK